MKAHNDQLLEQVDNLKNHMPEETQELFTKLQNIEEKLASNNYSKFY